MIERARKNGLVDRLALLLSGLCLAHCIATPLAVAVLASSASLLLSPAIHEAGLALAILLGGVALGPGLLRSGERAPALIGLAGFAIMALGVALGARFGDHGAEVACTVIGVLVVAFAHGLNRSRASR